MTTWLEHVKKTHAAGSTSYKESLKRASKTWKKQANGGDKKRKGKKRKGKKEEAEVEEKNSIEEPAPAKKKRKRAARKNAPKKSQKAYKNVDSITV